MAGSIDVAVGVIIDGARVLLAKRPAHLHQGDKWEFPGGKFEPGESLSQALSRELYEEIGIAIQHPREWFSHSFNYPEKTVNLHMAIVTHFEGLPHGKEGQPLEWVAIDQLHTLIFPDANKTIIERLQRGEWKSTN